MTAYQLQLLTSSGVSRQEIFEPLRSPILNSRYVCAALRLQGALMMQDGLAFLHLLPTAPHLMQCLSHMHLPAMRCLALEQLAAAYPPTSTHMSCCSPSYVWDFTWMQGN